MSDAEIVASFTIAIAGDDGSAGRAGVGCGAGVGDAAGLAGGCGVVRRRCPSALVKTKRTMKNENVSLDKFIFLDWSAGIVARKACSAHSRSKMATDNMGISRLRQNRPSLTSNAEKDVRVPSARELPHRLKCIDLIGVLVGSQTNDARKPQRVSALVAL